MLNFSQPTMAVVFTHVCGVVMKINLNIFSVFRSTVNTIYSVITGSGVTRGDNQAALCCLSLYINCTPYLAMDV